MNTYEEYKAAKCAQDVIVDALHDQLNTFPKGEFGLVEQSPEFKKLYSEYWREFNKLRAINQAGVKKYKKQILKEVNEKRKHFKQQN